MKRPLTPNSTTPNPIAPHRAPPLRNLLRVTLVGASSDLLPAVIVAQSAPAAATPGSTDKPPVDVLSEF